MNADIKFLPLRPEVKLLRVLPDKELMWEMNHDSFEGVFFGFEVPWTYLQNGLAELWCQRKIMGLWYAWAPKGWLDECLVIFWGTELLTHTDLFNLIDCEYEPSEDKYFTRRRWYRWGYDFD